MHIFLLKLKIKALKLCIRHILLLIKKEMHTIFDQFLEQDR